MCVNRRDYAQGGGIWNITVQSSLGVHRRLVLGRIPIIPTDTKGSNAQIPV
jgi:hypothetical protein